MKAELKVVVLAKTEGFEQNIARGAKLCYSSADVETLRDKVTEEEAQKFLNMIMGTSHGSILEHSSITFGIEGISRAIANQLVRHRIGSSYSQKSQRYVAQNQFEYIIPEEIMKIDSTRELYIKTMEEIQKTYDAITQDLLVQYINDYVNQFTDCPYKELYQEINILKAKDLVTRSFKEYDKKQYSIFEKLAIENARYVLPNACETKIQVTMNVRALFNFFKERLCERSQDEIRDMAYAMWLECMKISPTIFQYATPTCVHGKCKEGSFSCGRMIEYREKYKPVIKSFKNSTINE